MTISFIYIVLVVLIDIFGLFLTFLVFSSNKGRRLNQVFSLMTIASLSWITFAYLSDLSSQKENALLWNKLIFSSLIVVFVSSYFFSFLFPKESKRYPIIDKVVLVIGIITFFLSIFSPFIVKEIKFKEWGTDLVLGNGVYIIYFLTLLWCFSVFSLFRKFRKARGIEKVQIWYLWIGLFIFLLMNIIFNVVLPSIRGTYQFYQFGNFSIIFFLALTAYAIIRHRLMDIRVVITRSIIYFLLIALVTLTLTFTTIVSVQYFGETQTNRVIVALIAALLIVFGLEPLKRVISRATDKIFFKARIDYEGVLRRLSEIISLEIDIDKLVTTLTQTLAKELKIKQSIIILARPDHKPGRDVYEVRTEVHPHTPRIVLQPEDPLIKYFHEEQKMTVLEALERKIDDTADEKERAKLEGSRKEIEKIGAAVVAPVVAQNRLNAVLVLGPKLSGDSYSDEDLKLIEVLGPQIGSAIEKSKLYEEVKGFTKTLQNKVDQATSELRERNKFLLALQRVTNLITRSLDIKKVSQQIVNSVSSELGYIGGLLILIDDSGQRVYLEAITETPLTKKALKLLPKPISEYKGDLKTDKTLGIKAILEGKIQFGDHLDEFLSPPVPKLALRAIEKVIKVKSVVGVPIYSEDQIIGVIEVVLPKPKSEITKREIEMMKSLADQTGIVARNLRLFERIRKTNEELAEANERLKQLDQAKTEFVSIASHQLRTPMTGIMGYLSMLTAGDFGKLPPKHFKILTDLLGESQRMIRLINIFLNVSKIEAGKFELNKDNTVQLEDLIESEVKEVEKIANAKNIKLEFKKPKEKMPQIHADPDKLKDVMLNLIDNAVKYTSEGSITISVEKMVNEIKISVKDTGVGIKSEEAKQLFAKFSRGSGIARINPDGSGLGLFIAKKIIEGHEGQIWVESKGEGKGSTFSFTLPIK